MVGGPCSKASIVMLTRDAEWDEPCSTEWALSCKNSLCLSLSLSLWVSYQKKAWLASARPNILSVGQQLQDCTRFSSVYMNYLVDVIPKDALAGLVWQQQRSEDLFLRDMFMTSTPSLVGVIAKESFDGLVPAKPSFKVTMTKILRPVFGWSGSEFKCPWLATFIKPNHEWHTKMLLEITGVK